MARRAIASPMPVVLPVTMITLSFNRIALLLRFKNCFYYFARMHGLERLVPLCDRPHAAGDRLHIERARGDHADHSLPNRPVVTEAALQRHVFLHESIQREVDGLRAPADFADPPGRPNQI